VNKKYEQAVTGFSFGLTSAVITTLGTIAGLYSASKSDFVLVSGLLALAIADSLSDAMGIHLSEEAEKVHTTKEIWTSTGFTFVTKFFFTLSFIVPLLFFPLKTAIYADVVWGIIILSLLSFVIARSQNVKVLPVILEHDSIAFIAILVAGRAGAVVRFIIDALSG
jgi:VIT1/CCC1 family predicted Fe2+/Mn2+ transporter